MHATNVGESGRFRQTSARHHTTLSDEEPLKVYRGAPAAARSYVEADRTRADDYYLTEGTGVAERYLASPEAGCAVGER